LCVVPGFALPETGLEVVDNRARFPTTNGVPGRLQLVTSPWSRAGMQRERRLLAKC